MQPFLLSGELDGRSAIILASPHSGTFMPADFRATLRLPETTIRRMEDAHVGALLVPSAAQGLPLVEATHARAVLDLNRAPDEYDPSLFDGPLGGQPRLTDRVRRGHGLIPRLVTAGQPIHAGRISAQAGAGRIESLHRPWHELLEDGLSAAQARHGHALLLDLHSMPSLDGNAPAQVVLGDLNGRSAAPPIVNWLHQAFAATGLRVARNAPYAGGYTTERHGNPASGIHAVQIELDRALYMDCATLKPHSGFAGLSQMLAGIFSGLREALPTLVGPDHELLAAE